MEPFTTFSPPGKPHIVCHAEYEQGSDRWLQARCGLLTASNMKLIVTEKTMKSASNEKERAHMYELLAQRISGYVEPTYIGDEMLRGHEDEVRARIAYEERTKAKVSQVGLIVNDKWGFSIGCSPDGLIDVDPEGEGGIEGKSRRQKFQIQTILEHVRQKTVPSEFLMQVQTCLAVSERNWWDFLSYSGGLHMPVIRIYPDPVVQNAIVEISGAFEKRISERMAEYQEILASDAILIPTERVIEMEMYA